jgi:hypothetical protein
MTHVCLETNSKGPHECPENIFRFNGVFSLQYRVNTEVVACAAICLSMACMTVGLCILSVSTKPDLLSCPALQLLVKWWSDYPGGLLEQRVVQPIQNYLTKELMATKKLTISVMNAIKVCSTYIHIGDTLYS